MTMEACSGLGIMDEDGELVTTFGTEILRYFKKLVILFPSYP